MRVKTGDGTDVSVMEWLETGDGTDVLEMEWLEVFWGVLIESLKVQVNIVVWPEESRRSQPTNNPTNQLICQATSQQTN